MSSKQNDTNQINLGNYEEFFILYMDNELTIEQMKMVDEFLASHPDLRGEFEILMSVKLPSEEISFNKADLYAGSMKSASFINEDLLLYIDNELSADKTKVVELELNANKDYHLQHQLLLKTKLDATETISYPNKEELYRRTEKVVAFKLWMRVAAAIIFVAVLSFFYYKQTSVDSNNVENNLVKNEVESFPANTTDNEVKDELQIPPTQVDQNLVAANNSEPNKSSAIKTKDADQKNNKVQFAVQQALQNNDANNPIANNETYLDPTKYSLKEIETPTPKIKPESDTKAFASVEEPVNKVFVTNGLPDRKTDGITQEEETVAKKGSVKGFLRKATRLIEKRTGFDPTNENGELLLGVVAVKLK